MNRSIILHYVPIALIIVLAFRGFLEPGIVWKDDYVPLNVKYLYYSFYTWNSEEHAGTFSEYLPGVVFNTFYLVLAKFLGISLASRAYIVGIILFISLLMFWAIAVLQHINGKEVNGFTCFLGSLFYTINPWVTSRILSGHFLFLLSYAFSALFFSYLWKAVLSHKQRDILITSLLLGAVGMSSFHGYILMLLASAIVFMWVIISHSKRIFKIAIFMQIFFTSVLLNMFWILPTYCYIMKGTFPTVTQEPYSLSQNADFLNVVRLMGYFWEPYDKNIYLLAPLPNTVWIIFSFIPPLVVSASILVGKRFKDIRIPLFLLLLFALTLSQGTKLLGVYYISFSNLPFLQVIRDPNKVLFLGALSYSFLIGLSADDFSVAVKKVLSLFPTKKCLTFKKVDSILVYSLCISLVVLCINFPWLSGNFRGYYSVQQVPPYFWNADDFLSKQSGDFRVLYIPIRTGGINYTWGRGANEPIRYLSTKPIFNPPYPTTYERSPYTSLYLYSISGALWSNVTQRIGAVLGLANVKYVVARTDVIPLQESYSFLKALLVQKDLKLVWNEGNIYIFEVENWIPKIRLATRPILVVGGFRSVMQLPYSNIPLRDKFILFPEVDIALGVNLKSELAIFLDFQRLMDLHLSQVEKKYVIDPRRYSDGYNWILSSWPQTISLDLVQGGESLYAVTEEPLNVPFSIASPDDYRILIRVFGDPSILDLDGKSIKSITEGWSKMGFHWLSSRLELKNGPHTLSIAKGEGLLSLDKIVVIPERSYQELLRKSWANLANNLFILHIEGECMFPYGGQYITTSSSRTDLSGGVGILLKNNSWANLAVGESVTIPKSGSYMIRVRAATFENQSANLIAILKNQADGNTYKITQRIIGSDFQLYLSSPLAIESGNYSLVLRGDSVVVDFLEILPTESLVLFECKDDSIFTWRKLSPTDYRIIIIAPSNTSYVVFSESFDTSWHLLAGNVLEQAIHADLFAMAFEIPPSSPHEISLSFDIQKYFYVGAIISTVVFITCMFFILLRMVR